MTELQTDSAPVWYKDNYRGVDYYACHADRKAHFTPIGPGDRQPTPEEIAEAYKRKKHETHIIDESQDIDVYNDCIRVTWGRNANTTPALPPAGPYRLQAAVYNDRMIPERLTATTLRQDGFVPTDEYHFMRNEIQEFYKNCELYKQLQIIFKRGVLLYGPPGNGKTALIRQIASVDAPEGALIIFADEIPSIHICAGLQDLNIPLILVFEELTSYINAQNVDRILDFLDGEGSLTNCFIFATTNYPELLPRNVVDRPSRFDRLIRIREPDEALRIQLLEHYLGQHPDKDILQDTSGLSTAAIKEIALLHRLYGVPVNKAIIELKNLQRTTKKEFADTEKIGFTRKGGSVWD